MKEKLTEIVAVLMTVLAWSAGAVPHVVRFTEPAEENVRGWEERSLPLGNGWFGVNLFGGIGEELVTVTHNAVLTGREFAGKVYGNLTEALELRVKTELPPIGGHHPVVRYERVLDVDRAIATVTYGLRGVDYRRETFCSYPDKVLAMRIVATRNGKPVPAKVDVDLSFPCQEKGDASVYARRGSVRRTTDGIKADGVFPYYGVRFAGRVARIDEADGSVVFLFACDTNYRLRPETFSLPPERKLDAADDPGPRAESILAAARTKGWERLKVEHLADMARTLGAAQLDLDADPADALLTTDSLLNAYRLGRPSRYLEETYWQYGRYLLVASSRPGGLPANLQGIWAYGRETPWGSGYWHNINVQMNYWPAFNTNLAECFVPYAEFNAAFRPTTYDTAVAYLKRIGSNALPPVGERSDLWCVGCAVYPYDVGPGPGKQDGPGTGGLTTRLFTDWWEFTQDEQALRQYVFPVLHGMSDFLTRCVTNVNGKALAAFSASPEQIDQTKPWNGDWSKGPPYYNTVGCTFDQTLFWENAQALVRLARHLGTNDAVVARAAEQLDRYDPILIGESGQIKEYREERKYGEIGEYHHRHISQLMGLMPGTLVTAARPDWMAAAKKTLDFRGDESTGWALAHRLNCRARVRDGEGAYRLIRNLLAQRTYANLWDAHPPFQIDGNFGATAGMTEMLVQSHERDERGEFVVRLLPALPKEWPNGRARGLRVRGGKTVDFEWRDGKVVRQSVR